MIITPDMPQEPGTTVATHGALIDLMDIEDLDEQGIKVGFSTTYHGPHVTLAVDSTTYPHKTGRLTADDAEHLALMLLAAAKKAREY